MGVPGGHSLVRRHVGCEPRRIAHDSDLLRRIIVRESYLGSNLFPHEHLDTSVSFKK